MPYPDGAIKEKRRGFEYDPDYFDKLGVVERNGVRLIYNRVDGVLRVERMEPTLETVLEDLETVLGDRD